MNHFLPLGDLESSCRVAGSSILSFADGLVNRNRFVAVVIRLTYVL